MNQEINEDMVVEFTPLEKVESLYQALVTWYGDAEDKELRVAAKLLMVALDRFATHGGQDWPQLVAEYVDMLQHDPQKFEKMLEANRGELKAKNPADSLH